MSETQPGRIEVIALEGLPEITPGDDLCSLLADRLEGELRPRDVVVVTQKIVSKAEGRLVEVDPDDRESLTEIVLAESTRVLRRRGDLIISETSHGFVCANAGVDASNVADGTVALLPIDPDRSARRLRDVLRFRLGVEVGVIISDTFGRPWRRGVVDVAIGCAGLRPVLDLRGMPDARGRTLRVTEIAVVDEIASAAELVMGKNRNVPVAIVRGLSAEYFGEGEVAGELVRDPSEDLFR